MWTWVIWISTGAQGSQGEHGSKGSTGDTKDTGDTGATCPPQSQLTSPATEGITVVHPTPGENPFNVCVPRVQTTSQSFLFFYFNVDYKEQIN